MTRLIEWNVRRAGGALLAGLLAMVMLWQVPAAQAQTLPDSDSDAQATGEQPEQRSKPNIVIFVIDSLRADHVGAYGYTRRPTTPNIDALAKESVLFEQAYTPAPWTLPAIVSLMTSVYPCEHGVLHDGVRLAEGARPLAQRLLRPGYHSFALVANPYAGREFGLDRGFDVFQEVDRSGGRRVAKLLDAYPSEEFFLYLHNIEPHTPHLLAPRKTDGFDAVSKETREELGQRYEALGKFTRQDYEAQRPVGTTDNSKRIARHMEVLTNMRDSYVELYDAAVHEADRVLGTVINALKERGVWDETLFIVLSDHGEEFGEHGGWLHDQSVYEEVIHVPLVIRFPHGEFGGRRLHSVVSLVDVVPTICGYLQRPKAAEGTHGRDLMPVLLEREPDETAEFVVPAMRINVKKYYKLWKETRGDINVVVRKGNWKGIWNVEPDTLELYDLAADPGEQNDASKQHADLALAMQLFARLWQEQCQKNAITPEEIPQIRERARRSLRLLGYAE